MLKVLDLFSGIGGFSLGLESTGHFETIAFCEKDQFCQKVLNKHWSNVPIINDVRSINGKEIKADVITGGVPCQPISIAGKQKGEKDDRFLFPEMLRIVKEIRPRWTIIENVQNLINIANGTILKDIVERLEAENFEVQCFSISASSQGAWHKRERIWIVANSNNRLSIGENQEIQTRRNTIDNGSSSNVPNSDSKMRRRRGTELKSGTNKIWGFYTKKEKQSEQNFWSKAIGCNDIFREEKNSWWETIAKFYRIPDGLSISMDRFRKDRIKALGNSIVPQIAREIGKAIIAAEIKK